MSLACSCSWRAKFGLSVNGDLPDKRQPTWGQQRQASQPVAQAIWPALPA
jgi:hypothetical protein